MKIVQKILTTNNCYKTGRKRARTEGSMVHSVGCNQPDAEVFVKQWAANRTDVCPHAIVDAVQIIQLLPWDRYAFHACDPANAWYIGVETTEPATIKYTGGANFVDLDPVASKKHIDAVYKNTVELFAYLCEMYKLDPSKDIISHNEGRIKGIASAHVDPEHIWSKYGYTMDGFRRDVKAAMAKPAPSPEPTTTLYRVQTGAFAKPENASAIADKLKKAGFDTFLVKSDDLYKVQVGAFADRDNANAMAAKLKAAGYDTYITTKGGTAVTAVAPKKTVDELAREVLEGKWGNGDDRKRRLEAAGYDYSAVQKRVNELLR